MRAGGVTGYDAPVEERLAQLLAWPNVSHRRMFNADCFLVGGSMFLILPPEGVAAFKLPDPEREELLGLPGAGPFVVSIGAFGKWVQAPLASLDDGPLVGYARAACEHVRANPPKKSRKKRLRKS